MSVTAKVEAWAGGGSGGSATSNAGVVGGGGGAYSRNNTQPLLSGTAYTVTVGLGGAGITGNSSVPNTANAGGDSWFKDTSTLLAKGGGPGDSFGFTGGSSGGQASSGIGDVKFSGGNGGSVSSSNTVTGGGGGAGDANNGGNGTANSVTPGSGGASGGGQGGFGQASGGSINGSSLGGGGGGRDGGGTSGSGANGKVVISVAQGLIASATGGTKTNDGTNDIWTFTSSGTWTPSIPQSYSLSLLVGAFVLAGIAIGFGHQIVAVVAKFVVTGYNAILDRSPWHRAQRDSSTFSNQTKHASTFSTQSKNSGSWSDQTKH